METKVKDQIRKPVVTREEMEQLVSTAERLSDELARARASKQTATMVGLVVLVGGTGALIGFLPIARDFIFRSNEALIAMLSTLVLLLMTFMMIYASLITTRRFRTYEMRIALLKSSLASIMDMLEEARGFYEKDLSPIERATLNVRLQTIGFS